MIAKGTATSTNRSKDIIVNTLNTPNIKKLSIVYNNISYYLQI